VLANVRVYQVDLWVELGARQESARNWSIKNK
jgi:hypothetical protein